MKIELFTSDFTIGELNLRDNKKFFSDGGGACKL
jgi:hypothetical protein